MGRVSGEGRPETVGRCQGSVVIIREITVLRGRTHLKIESVVNGSTGWVTDNFAGNKFDTTKCRAHFSDRAHIQRCEGGPL